jgi:hypothetical protein
VFVDISLPTKPRTAFSICALIKTLSTHILASEREVEAKAAAPTTVDPIQQTVAEELKDALRRQTVDRELAKNCIRFLGQPMGRSLHAKLKRAYEAFAQSRGDDALLTAVSVLADEFGKDRPTMVHPITLLRENLELICFEYVTG